MFVSFFSLTWQHFFHMRSERLTPFGIMGKELMVPLKSSECSRGPLIGSLWSRESQAFRTFICLIVVNIQSDAFNCSADKSNWNIRCKVRGVLISCVLSLQVFTAHNWAEFSFLFYLIAGFILYPGFMFLCLFHVPGLWEKVGHCLGNPGISHFSKKKSSYAF